MASPAPLRSRCFVWRLEAPVQLPAATSDMFDSPQALKRGLSCHVRKAAAYLLLYASPLVGAEKQGALCATMFFEQADLVPPG
jgi:hypothetical protein